MVFGVIERLRGRILPEKIGNKYRCKYSSIVNSVYIRVSQRVWVIEFRQSKRSYLVYFL